MENRYSYLLRFILALGDFFVLNISYLVGYITICCVADKGLSTQFGLSKILIFNLGWVTLASIMKLYATETIVKLENIFRQTIQTVLLHGIFFLIFLVYSNEDKFALRFVPICYGVMLCLFAISRFFLTYILEFLLKKAKLHTKIAIVGHNETGLRLAEYFLYNQSTYSFQGFFDERTSPLKVAAGGEIVEPIEECIHFAAANDIREIYSTILPAEHLHLDRLIEIADQNCVRVKFVPDFSAAALLANYHIEYLDTIPIITVRTEPLQQDIGNRFKKRAFDLVFSSLVIVLVLSWLMPIIALIIKLESKGPVFFRQQRSGRDNRPFWCYKFRSMTVNPHSDDLQASRGDARITKVGAFIRKASLDELPQFFNVLIGNMSVVGPRPHMLKHTEQYSAINRKYMIRQFLKPGITGWAQVNGYRGETKDQELMAKRVEYDIHYMETWSRMLDVKIIFMTIIGMFKGDQNAF